MKFTFKKNLSDDEVVEIISYASLLDIFPVEQSPLWEKLFESRQSAYFICRDANKICCFAIIKESGFSLIKFSRIYFGPLFKDPDILIDCIDAIVAHYKQNNFLSISIQLAIPTGSQSDYIEFKLNKKYKIKYKFDRHNWSSLVVDLAKEEKEILGSFSKGHKSSIKKSLTMGVKTTVVNSVGELSEFARIYHKMNSARNLKKGTFEDAEEKFKKIFLYTSSGNGFILLVKDAADILIGGVIILKQGRYGRYYIGASDPDRKDISVLHTAIHASIISAKEMGLRYMDLWGYNLYVDETDQLFYINRFKKGFSDQLLFFPKWMHIDLVPSGYGIIRMAEWITKHFLK